ncbi:MAG: hypothetical protein ACR2JF_14460 [Iamia sp.]
MACALLLVTAACGDDDDSASDDTTTTSADTSADTSATEGQDGDGGAEATSLELTLTDGAIEGVPEEIPAGLVEMTVTDETDAAGAEVSFTRVEEGTDAETFTSDILNVFDGGPFPDYFLGTTGGIEQSEFTVEEGSYLVWYDASSNADREAAPEDVVVAPLTVTAGTEDASLPETDGTITTTDYEFDVDVDIATDGSTFTLQNDSEEQFHHVVLVDFGDNDPATVEENLPAILESGGDPSTLPEGIDPEQIDFDFATSTVYGPGEAGTFDADFAEGTTYAALCFIQDRTGGAPHAIQHQMYEVFQA